MKEIAYIMAKRKAKNTAIRYSLLFSFLLHALFFLVLGLMVQSRSFDLPIEVELKDLPLEEDSQLKNQVVQDLPRPYLPIKPPLPQSQEAARGKLAAPLMSAPLFSASSIRPLPTSAAASRAVEKISAPLPPDSAQRSVGSNFGGSGFGYSSGQSGRGSAFGQIKPIPLPQIPLRTAAAYEQPDQTIAYRHLIHQHINRYKRFPPLAVRQGWEGSVGLRFLLHRNGQVEEIQVIKSSKIAILDEAAVAAVKSGSPFPPFPNSITDPSLWFEVTLSFELRGRYGLM